MNTKELSSTALHTLGSIDTGQKKIAPQKKFTKFLPRSEPRHEGDWNVLVVYTEDMDRLGS